MFEINIDNHIKKIDFSSIICYTESDNGKTTVWVKGNQFTILMKILKILELE